MKFKIGDRVKSNFFGKEWKGTVYAPNPFTKGEWDILWDYFSDGHMGVGDTEHPHSHYYMSEKYLTKEMKEKEIKNIKIIYDEKDITIADSKSVISIKLKDFKKIYEGL